MFTLVAFGSSETQCHLSQGAAPAILQIANDVRIAGVLLEGGADAQKVQKTEALMLW